LETYWTALPLLVDRRGVEAALALARVSVGAIEAVRALGEDVWLRQAGMLLVSATPRQDAAVERAVRVARELGVPRRQRRSRPPRSPSAWDRLPSAKASTSPGWPPSSRLDSCEPCAGLRSPREWRSTSEARCWPFTPASWSPPGLGCAPPRSSSPPTPGLPAGAPSPVSSGRSGAPSSSPSQPRIVWPRSAGQKESRSWTGARSSTTSEPPRTAGPSWVWRRNRSTSPGGSAVVSLRIAP